MLRFLEEISDGCGLCDLDRGVRAQARRRVLECCPPSVTPVWRFHDVSVPAVTVSGDPAFEGPCAHRREDETSSHD